MGKTSREESGGPSPSPEKAGSSGSGCHYKGVRRRKWGKWVAEVRLPNSRERIWLGSYDRPEKAARAYDAAVYCLRGPTATFNFPDTPPEIPSAGSLNPEQIRDAAVRYANEGGSSETARDAAVQQSTEVEAQEASAAPENLISRENWGFMETFLQDSGRAEQDFGIFPALGDFPAGRYLPAEDEDDEASDGNLFQPSPLWSF